MREAHVHAFTDNARVARDRGADNVRAEYEDGVVIEVGAQPFLGQLHAIAFDAGEAEHRDGHDAADGTAKLSGLADSVHDLAEQFLGR